MIRVNEHDDRFKAVVSDFFDSLNRKHTALLKGNEYLHERLDELTQEVKQSNRHISNAVSEGGTAGRAVERMEKAVEEKISDLKVFLQEQFGTPK